MQQEKGRRRISPSHLLLLSLFVNTGDMSPDLHYIG